MISGATNASIDIVRGKLIPGTHLLENYKTLIETQNLGLAMFNSFRNAIVITVIIIATNGSIIASNRIFIKISFPLS